MAARLTDTKVDSLKAPKGKRLEVFDAEPGLLLRVSPEGSKTWFLRYRTPDGRQPRFKLGTYPATGVKDARERAQAARKVLEAGSDPAAAERKSKAAARVQAIKTFDDLVQAYFAACETGVWMARSRKKRASTIKGEKDVYARHVKPVLGRLLLGEVGRAEVRSMVRALLARGIGAKCNQAHALVRQAFAYAMAEELVTENPAVGITAAPKKARERILTGVELKSLWEALEQPTALMKPDGDRVHISRRMAIALQLTMLLLQRRQDIAGMRDDGGELDLKAGLWTIPAARFKSSRPQVVPLPPKAVELIEEAITLRDRPATKADLNKTPEQLMAEAESPYVFPAARGPVGPIHPDSLTHAMGALSVALEFTARAAPHDLRRTGATKLSAEGVAPFIISLVLGHSSDGGGGAMVTRQHYNLHRYDQEKRTALTIWENLLLEIVGERVRPTNVVVIDDRPSARS